MGGTHDSKSANSSDAGSDWRRWISQGQFGGGGAARRTSASMVETVKSVRSVALDSGRSLSRRARSRCRAVMSRRGALPLGASRVEEEAKPSGMDGISFPRPGSWRRSAPDCETATGPGQQRVAKRRPQPAAHHPQVTAGQQCVGMPPLHGAARRIVAAQIRPNVTRTGPVASGVRWAFRHSG